jgi:hypothetical protein
MPERVEVALTLPEVDLVLQSMGQRPYEMVADLIGSIRNQVVRQIEELNKPPAAEDETSSPGGTD